MTLTSLLKRAEKFSTDNSPTILTAIGVVGTLTTAYLTGKASFEAARIIEFERNEELFKEKGSPEFDLKQKVKFVWKEYIPAVGTGAVTVSAIIFANRINSKRAAAMALAYSVTEHAFEEYKEKVVERLGQKKEQTVRDELAQEQINRNPVGKHEVIVTGGGDVLCYDTYTGRYFQSSMETLRKAENEVNFYVLHNDFATLNDFYRYIGLSTAAVGEEVGWTCDQALQIEFSTTMSDDSRPCIVINYLVSPIRKYV